MTVTRILVMLALSMTVTIPPQPDPDLGFRGTTQGNEMQLTGATAAGVLAAAEAVDPAVRLDEYRRADLCGTGEGGSGFMNTDCSGYDNNSGQRDCAGEEPVPPVWHRHRNSAAEDWGPWSLSLGWTCPQNAVPVFSVTDLRRLPIAPSVLSVQPPRPQVLVNMPTIVFADPAVQSFTTTLLGYPVEVEATPTRFTWDFGDGSDPLVTTSPGHPYPDEDVAYPYPRPGTYTITLTTDFTGRYRVGGTPTWFSVVGTATTTTTSPPIEAIEVRSHLVAEDCISNPDGPYC
jgi:hypothetical protein